MVKKVPEGAAPSPLPLPPSPDLQALWYLPLLNTVTCLIFGPLLLLFFLYSNYFICSLSLPFYGHHPALGFYYNTIFLVSFTLVFHFPNLFITNSYSNFGIFHSHTHKKILSFLYLKNCIVFQFRYET